MLRLDEKDMCRHIAGPALILPDLILLPSDMAGLTHEALIETGWASE